MSTQNTGSTRRGWFQRLATGAAAVLFAGKGTAANKLGASSGVLIPCKRIPPVSICGPRYRVTFDRIVVPRVANVSDVTLCSQPARSTP